MAFKGYIVEDSLYLREYAKVIAWAMTKAQSMQQLGVFYSLLAFVNESEDATRRQYLRRWHLSQQQIELLPLRRENQAYVGCHDCGGQNRRRVNAWRQCCLAC
jgi:thiaminase/transcriptional activator TenA